MPLTRAKLAIPFVGRGKRKWNGKRRGGKEGWKVLVDFCGGDWWMVGCGCFFLFGGVFGALEPVKRGNELICMN